MCVRKNQFALLASCYCLFTLVFKPYDYLSPPENIFPSMSVYLVSLLSFYYFPLPVSFSMSISMSMSVCLSVSVSLSQSLCLSLFVSVSVSVSLSLSLSLSFFSLSLSPSPSASLAQSMYLNCLFVRLHVYYFSYTCHTLIKKS